MAMSESVENSEYEALLKEYQSLRSEIELAIRNQVRILGYGGTVLGVFAGIGVVRPSFLISTALPSIAFFFAVLWSIEQTRMMRAGDYISTIESRLNDEHFGEPVMLWESWLRYRGEGQPEWDIYQIHYWSQYLIIAVFILIEAFGIVSVLTWNPGEIQLVLKLGLTTLYLLFIGVMFYVLMKVVRHKSIKASFGRFRDN
jgi:hypothetical protein